MTMKVGFTGSREGTTADQRLSMVSWWQSNGFAEEFHHGCCVGADADACRIVMFPHAGRIVGHPPENTSLVSYFCLRVSDEQRDPLPYLERNRAIVDASDVLLACPKGPEQRKGSGTWATIRYARAKSKPVVVFWPDGRVEAERKD